MQKRLRNLSKLWETTKYAKKMTKQFNKTKKFNLKVLFKRKKSQRSVQEIIKLKTQQAASSPITIKSKININKKNP